MSTGALYPGTFDPVTNGHYDLVRRAAGIFDRVVIAIAASPGKEPLFSLDERVTLVRAVMSDIEQAEVIGYAGLTVEFACEQGLNVVLRGLRAVSDFEYEFQLATMSRQLNEDVETVFMTPAEQFTYISAGLVREVASLGGDVSKFVDPVVEKALRAKFSDAPRRLSAGS